jgi:hypothetical protein
MTTATLGEGTLPSSGVNLSVHHVTREITSVAQEKHREHTSECVANASGLVMMMPSKDSSIAEENNNGSNNRGEDPQGATNGEKVTKDFEDSRFPYNRQAENGMCGASPPQPVAADEGAIDSALLAALRDPRERLGLLKLEQAMVDFMNASDSYIEVGGPYNAIVISPTSGVIAGGSVISDRPQTTFQRCILHRLADRFSIVRENGSLAEGCIRLVKLKESTTPKKLLLHLDPSEYNPSLDDATKSIEQMSLSNQNNNGSNNVSGNKSRPRKMKIMKRNSSGDSNKNSDDSRSAPRKSKTFSDKEKAYAEARARIFSDEQGEQVASPATPAAASSAAPSPTITPPTSQHGSNSSTSLDADAAFAEDRKARTRASGSTSNKATWRNRQQEENDPDFQRGGPMVVQPSYGTDVYGGYSGGGATVYPPQNTQQHFYPAYSEENTAYYAGQGQQQSQQQQQQPTFYNNSGRGRGRGYATTSPRYYNNNTNNYHQGHQQQNYHQGRTSSGEAANLHSLEEFPSLR